MQAPDLVLRDIHQPPPPDWWPPAPGWWLVFGGMLLAAIVAAVVLRRRRAVRLRYMRLFDDEVAAATTPVARLAAMSALLRRAARRIDPHADRLTGDDWMRFLDRGARTPAFSGDGVGALLRDGGFRRDLAAADVDAVQTLARQRFARLMAARR
ncbi:MULTISPECIES: DUF4381 family protein [Luteimonas]|uniref:DUF4381 family protein n=1 Tax=Luteimonas TaxID=83614 RepID=UPI000C7C2765|nr:MULTISPECIES: DUF4381 family protein [Luteimonas]